MFNQENTIDPETMIKQYGADAVRWFILSDSPPDKDILVVATELMQQTNFAKDLNLNYNIVKN